jgi:hypothetical protein
MPQESTVELALAHALAYVAPAAIFAPNPRCAPSTTPSTPNAALRRCRIAWQRAFKAYMDQSKGSSIDQVFAARKAGDAYCKAMPMLTGLEGIRDFVACAAHGILIDAITRDKSTQLLYAAQVALGALSREPKPPRSDA